MWALIQPSTLALLFGPSAWTADSFRGALAAALPGFTPFLSAGEPSGALTWEGVDLAIVPATQTFSHLGPFQAFGTPTSVVTAASVTQTFPAVTSPALLAAEASAVSRRSFAAQLQGQALTQQRKGNFAGAVKLLLQAQGYINV